MKRWSRMSEVERVEVYTRQSMYMVLWFTEIVALVTLFQDTPDRRGQLVLVAAIAVVTSVVATQVLRRVMEEHPAITTVPWGVAWTLPIIAVVGAAVLVPLDDEIRGIGALLVVIPIACSLAGVRGRTEAVALVAASGAYLGLVWWNGIGVLVGAAVAVFFVFTVRVSLWVLDVVTQLERTRDAGARLAVAEERLRFSRDVHDVMGRRLSTIAVQSELAATLVERGDPRAAPQMLEVRGVAHEALREARELARGYRPTDLGQELAGARSLLRSAGIAVELAVDDVPSAWHEPAGWVIREAVTNVLRHSQAGRVSLTWHDDVLAVENDGARAASPDVGGAGLQGLRERLAPLGAELETDHDEGRFALRARFPREVST